MPLWLELPVLLVVAACVAVLIRTFLLQAFMIPSGSMMNTLLVGDRVLVDKVVYEVRAPRRGEIVVFHGTGTWRDRAAKPVSQSFSARLGRTLGDLVGKERTGERDFIKRVIALPGDRVACCDRKGRVMVNGQPIDEPYIFENARLEGSSCMSRRFPEKLVPAGHRWVMGDHRGNSMDARCNGPVAIEDALGRAFVVLWPRSSLTWLPLPPPWNNPAAAASPPS
jgi:signal peptidase I